MAARLHTKTDLRPFPSATWQNHGSKRERNLRKGAGCCNFYFRPTRARFIQAFIRSASKVRTEATRLPDIFGSRRPTYSGRIFQRGVSPLRQTSRLVLFKCQVRQVSYSATTLPMEQAATTKQPLEICILAGGLSSRMGQNKSQLRLGGKALIAHIRATAKKLNLPIRVIRHDLVPRCGPLGGVYTALKTSSANGTLFLACDMPQVSEPLLKDLIGRFRAKDTALFCFGEREAGFPFLLDRNALPVVERLITENRFSLQALAHRTGAKKFRPGPSFQTDLLNVNTPDDWKQIREIFSKKN